MVQDDVVAADLPRRGDDERRRVLLRRLRHDLRHLERHGGVEPPGLERGQARTPLGDDRIADAVEVGTVGDEVVAVSLQLDGLASRVLLELERPRAHSALAQVGERHVGRVDGRVAGGEHEEERRLRTLELEDHRVGVGRLDRLDVDVPVTRRMR